MGFKCREEKLRPKVQFLSECDIPVPGILIFLGDTGTGMGKIWYRKKSTGTGNGKIWYQKSNGISTGKICYRYRIIPMNFPFYGVVPEPVPGNFGTEKVLDAVLENFGTRKI